MALSTTGFARRTYDEILSDKIKKAKELFGEDIETSELTPLGKYIRINAYDQALTEEEAELIYFSIFPNTAFGTSLDRLCEFVGIKRNAATNSIYKVTFTGEVGATIPSGFSVGTESEVTFLTQEDVVIGENGTVDTTVICEYSGEIGNVAVKEIDRITNPSADVESVEGKELVAKGNETESDFELRNRFNVAKEGLGSCNASAIKAALLRVPSVKNAGVIVNETDETDTAGRPPRSFECFVDGGENYHEEIAETILDKKPIGIKTFGNISHDIVDDGGYTHTLNFSHAESAPVYLRVAVKTSAEFEGENGKQKIKSNLETYIDNVGIGKPVVYSALYGKIHSVAGVQEVTELQMCTDGSSWSTNNIEVLAYQVCVCTQVEIKLNNGEYEVVS